MKRRDFISNAALAGAAVLIGSKKGFSYGKALDLEEATLARLQEAMASGRSSSASITRGYLLRISNIDKRINSIIELNPDAIPIAVEMDRERRAGRVRGPLHGIPVVLKDNIDTADKMKTTAGSLALVDAPTPKKDAFIVSRLRAAGAVILGKTNLSEWANFRDNDSISGWSGRGGQTRNPYILDRNPCGSSSGTGAAISANLAAVGIGTETDGSIVCPSSVNGIVGIKPTIGVVSRSGIIPIAASQDTAGPMARTVADAAALLGAIAAVDPEDAVPGSVGMFENGFSKYLVKGSLRGARIGVAKDYWGRNAAVDKVMDAALEVMKREGAELVDVRFPNLRRFGAAEFEVLQYEFKDGLEKYLRSRGGKHLTLDSLIRFNTENSKSEMPYFGQSIFETSAKKGDLTSKEYLEAVATCRKYAAEEGIDKVMSENRLDAIAGPSNGPTWMIDTVAGDCTSGYVSSSSMPAVAGYPNITVPAGFIKELPIGISFFGSAWSDGKLISLAYSFEQATAARRKPRLLSTYTV
ncbi:MAG: amidase [Acidobacteriota bacterium]|nr:MAG: amidase [Acidobacteriota bacterium]